MLALLLAGCASGGQAVTGGGGHPAVAPQPVRSPLAGTPAGHRPAGVLPARLVLPSTTMTAGSSMTGYVLVENTTGHAIGVAGCGSLFQVLLTSRDYRPIAVWPTCLQLFTIPVGQTRYRVPVSASYSQCSQGRGQDGVKACPPGPRMPPLPGGTYRAQLLQSARLIRVPPAPTVDVIPPGR